MSLVTIGEFTVDVEERRIYNQQGECLVEPKVIDVLCYLIMHADRFVSLKELHAEVWTGRIVTDTAVRRTISKLRAFLGDSDTENPRYIKSQMKRGYQLVCSVSAVSTAVAPAMETIPVAVSDGASKKTPVRKPILILVAVAVMMLASIYYFYVKPDHQFNQLVEGETLLSIPGQKTSLSITKDGSLQAFVGKIDNSSNWELYLYDATAGQLKKIATPTEHCRFVSFIDNDTRLAYVGYDGSVAKLYTQSVLNLTEPPVLHPTEPFKILAQPVGLEENIVLLNAAKSISDNFHYYKYNLIANTFEQFTYSSEDGIQDVFATVSPDKKLLALGRGNLNKRNVMLQIYRIADKELIAEHKLQDNQRDFRLSWQDNNVLLTRTGNKHFLVNINNGERTAIVAKPAPLHEFSFSETGELYGLSYHISEPNIYQARWPLADNFNKSYQLGANARELSFSHDGDYLWLIEKENNAFHLYRYSDSKNLRQLVIESPEPFSLQDQTDDGSLLLLTRNNRLEIFNTITAEFTTVSVSTQDVRTGNFSRSGEYVFFLERIKDQWLTKRYRLADKTQSVVLKDHMFIQDIADGYVAADSSGNVWRLDNAYERTNLLYQGVLFDLEYQIIARDNQLIIAFRTLMGDWVLADVNLASQQIWQRSMPFHDFGKPFSIDNTGQNLIFKTNIKEENQLVRYGYNFGYN